MRGTATLMPIYHFHVANEVQGESLDCDGTELPDPESARREATRLAGAMIADSASAERCPGIWHIGVTDHDGTTLFNLDLTIRPAASRSARPHPLSRELRRHGLGA